MSEHPELICAYLLDGHGRGEPLDWPRIRAWAAGQGALWVHLDANDPLAAGWLSDGGGLSPFVIDALLAEETRPRCEDYGDGILVILRGVNLNPGSDAEDMVSIRIWTDGQRVISTRMRRLMAVEDVRQQLETGKGPVSAGHLVARLAARLTERMDPVIEHLGDEVATLEDRMIDSAGEHRLDLRDVRHPLIDIRRVSIALRRYIAPQRDAINRLASLDADWIDTRIRGRLRETVDRVTRMVEALDEVRERSAVVQDELANRLSQRMEKTMYVLTVVATVMLPLGFLTGLLGINVGGIPGAETPWAFWAVCVALTGLVVFEVWLFKRLRWL